MPFKSGRVARAALPGLAAIGLIALAACGGGLGMHRSAAKSAPPPNAIGVNSYLWRATLDTLAFMPLSSADPYGGVVITDWYANPEKPDERFKCTVYILDTRLRGDALKVTVFKEVSNGAGGWTSSQASDQTSVDIENAILTRARQLRLSNLRG
jgi:hypothetical protein